MDERFPKNHLVDSMSIRDLHITFKQIEGALNTIYTDGLPKCAHEVLNNVPICCSIDVLLILHSHLQQDESTAVISNSTFARNGAGIGGAVGVMVRRWLDW